MSQVMLEAPSFGGLALRPETIRALSGMGWAAPTPVQTKTIPLLQAGRDVVAQAQTGSGKTGAFGVPIAESLAAERAVQALVLVPTRELAVQVTDDLRAIGVAQRVRAVALYGGEPINRQIQALARGAQIVVATPGRLLDHLERRTVRLDRVRTVILDEADRMLDMGFLPDVSRILAVTPASRQTALFSATIPDGVRAVAERHMRSPVWVRLASPAPTVDTVEQFYLEVLDRDKVRGLRSLLGRGQFPSALVFRRTQRGVERLVDALGRTGIGASALHGGMAQPARLKALRRFESGDAPLLIATNVASRGLDLPDVSHVVNFDMPEDVETYIHRVGRTARAGREGTAITFVTERDLEVFDALRRTLGDRLRPYPLNLYA